MGNSASSQKYHPDAVGPASPIWAPQSKFNQHRSKDSEDSSNIIIDSNNPPTSTTNSNPNRSPVNRVPVPLYQESDIQKDPRKSFSGPIRNRPSNPSSSFSTPARSRSTTNSPLSPSNLNPNHHNQLDSSDPAGSVPPFFPSKVSTQPKQPPIFELEDESKSILEPSDHGHSPHTLPVPLAEALKHGLGKSADELDRQYREQEEQAAARGLQSRNSDQVEMIQEEGNWMNQKGKKRETGETDRERLLAYWEQNEGGSRNGSLRGVQSSTSSSADHHAPDLTPHVKPGFRRPRPHSWNSNQRPSSSQTIMSFATSDSNNSANVWSSEWQDTRGGPPPTSRPASGSSSSREGTFTPVQGYSSAYSYGAELETPMEEEEEWQTPAERPDMDRFSFSQDEDQGGDSDTEVNEGRFTPQPQQPSSSTPIQQSSALPQATTSYLSVPPPQQSKNASDEHNSSSRKQSKASLLSAAAASSTADPELDAEQEDGRSSHDRRRRSLLAGLGESMNLDKDQEMDDQQVENLAEEEEMEDRDEMEVEETIGLALEGPPEANHQWPNQSDLRDSSNLGSNSLRSSRISNRTNMSSESYALHAAVETLRKGPSPMIDRRAIDELFEGGENSRDTMEGVIETDDRGDSKTTLSNQPPISPVKRNRAASLMDRLRGRVRKGSDASNLNPNSTPSSTNSQDWSTSGNLNSPMAASEQSQNTPKSPSSGSFFNSRLNRPRAHSAAQPINRSSPFPFITSSSNSPSRERRQSDAMAVDQDGLSEGMSETTAKPQRNASITRRALLRKKTSNSRIKKNSSNQQTSTFVASGSTPISSSSSSNTRTLAHKRSATGSITNASPRSHSARSVRSKRSSGASLRSAYRKENANLSDSSLGPSDAKRSLTPSKGEDQNGRSNSLKVSPPSLSLRRKGSPMPIRNSYLSEQRRPLPLPASATNNLPTSSVNQVNVESEQSAKKVKPKLVKLGLGRRNSENANAETGGVWEDVETLDQSKKSMEGNQSPIDASPISTPISQNRRWSGGWSWSKKSSPNVPVVELPPTSSNEITEIRSVSPLAHIESHGIGSSSQLPSSQQNNDAVGGTSSSYRSPSSSFSSLAPPPTPALPPPPRKSNRRRNDSSTASLVETTSSSAQQSPSEASFANLALSSRKGSLPDSLPSHEQKRFSNGSNSNGNRNSVASSSSSPHDRTASPSSPRQENSPNLAPMVSGLAAFAPSSPAAPTSGIPLDEGFEENRQVKERRSRGDSETVSDAGTKEILLSENDEELIRAHNALDTEIEAQAFPQLLTPKASPSQQRRSRNGSSIPPPALSPVKEASIHKTPSFASENLNDFSSDLPSLPHSISPSSSTVDLKKFATNAVGPAPNSPASSSMINHHNSNKFNPSHLAAQKSSSSFQKHSGEDVSYSSSSPSTSLKQLLNMHPQSRVRKPSQAESDVSFMSANGKVLDSISLASAPTTSTSPGRRLGSHHSHSRSLSGGTNVGGAEDRLSNLLVENQNAESSSNSFGTEFHSLPRTPRRPLPPIPDHAPIQTRGSRSFSLPSGKAPAIPTNAELRSWKQFGEDEEENVGSIPSNQKKAALQPRRSEPHRALKNLINSSKPYGSSLASELGLEGSNINNHRQRTFSAPTASLMNSKAQMRDSNQPQDENQSPVPFADSGVQASLAALAALEASRGDGEDEDPRAAWARERILGIKDGSTSVVSRLSVLNDNDLSRRSASEEISGSEVEFRGSRDRRRASPYSKSKKSRRDGNRSSDGGYSSSARGGREIRSQSKSAFSNRDGFHPRDFTGMATASGASLAEFEASQDESEGTTAIRNQRSRKNNSRSIPPSFLVSPPVANQEEMQVDSNNQSNPGHVNDWDEMVVPALRKRIEQEKQFELEQIQSSRNQQMNVDFVNHQTSSSNLSSNVSPTLVSSSFYNPVSSSGFMGSSVESRTTGVPFPRESFSNSSPKSSRLLPSESSRAEGRKSFDSSNRNPEGARDEYHQDHRRRRRSETSRSHHHHSSPKQSRPKTSERKQVGDDHHDKYGSLSSTFRSPSSFSKHHSPIQTFSQLSSNSRHLPPSSSHQYQHSSPKRSVSHEVSSSKTRSPPTASLNISVRTGNGGTSSRRGGSKKPSKQGFSGEDILAWQSSISGFVG